MLTFVGNNSLTNSKYEDNNNNNNNNNNNRYQQQTTATTSRMKIINSVLLSFAFMASYSSAGNHRCHDTHNDNPSDVCVRDIEHPTTTTTTTTTTANNSSNSNDDHKFIARTNNDTEYYINNNYITGIDIDIDIDGNSDRDDGTRDLNETMTPGSNIVSDNVLELLRDITGDDNVKIMNEIPVTWIPQFLKEETEI